MIRRAIGRSVLWFLNAPPTPLEREATMAADRWTVATLNAMTADLFAAVEQAGLCPRDNLRVQLIVHEPPGVTP